LPIENHVAKKLGLHSKKEIEAFGIEAFNQKCRESVRENEAAFVNLTKKMGQFIDVENPYITFKNEYIETEWWILKKFFDEGYFYEGNRVMPYCPRCGTGLASHEVAQGYMDVSVDTVIVPMKLKEKDAYFLVWTTTPWTLLSNVGLCVNPNETYVLAEKERTKFILGESLAEKVLGNEFQILETYKGKELEYTEYEQLIPEIEIKEKAFFVCCDEYVTMEDGTGIVHIAPAYGEDDSFVSKQNGIAFVNLVDKEGKFVADVEPWAGKFVKKCDESIVNYLKENNKLFSSARHMHSYPHCWRCDTPLLYYPKESWFVAMSTLRDKLVENNNKIHWYPDTIRTGRFGKFVENVIDWGISRDRYWGTPLPIWKCECGHIECVGSIEELKQKGINVPEDIELHKPYIDEVHLKCEKCGKEMTRAKEVIDCWFDSGSMPFAQLHYPFENKELFDANYPAQFISEAVDQTRRMVLYITCNINSSI